MDPIKEIVNKVDASIYEELPLYKWRDILNKECQCYVFNEAYLCKRFDQINYKFCSKDECEEIVEDNIYALLRYKYFKVPNEKSDDKIANIVKTFTSNLKSTLIRISFDEDADCKIVSMLNNYCIAFRNGVYDFKNDRFLFKYNIINIEELHNKIYYYDPDIIILWYIDINFDPLDINIMSLPLDHFISILKQLTQSNKNYCFELIYNMSHDSNHKFSLPMFQHCCEIMGFALLQSFSQHFVMLVGGGQNGKNSLFDGCLTGKLNPKPAANSLDEIEEDKFITGALENRYQNIFLESSAHYYKDSKMLKALTGSMYQTIQQKGINKYSGLLNVKFIFAANDQDKLKFSDVTPGFKRRINVFEIYYKWDVNKNYLKDGDYYDVSFSDDYSEIKNDLQNLVIFIYLAMYGIKESTKDFTSNFKFLFNDWRIKYADIDYNLRDKINNLKLEDIVNYITYNPLRKQKGMALFFDIKKKRLYNSPTLNDYDVKTYDDMISFLKNEEQVNEYFSDNDVYINIRILQDILNDTSSSMGFTSSLKKIYDITDLIPLYNNQNYARCTFKNGRLKILK